MTATPCCTPKSRDEMKPAARGPTSLSSQMRPPISSTSCEEIARPEPGAAIAARRGRIGLHERPENLPLLVLAGCRCRCRRRVNFSAASSSVQPGRARRRRSLRPFGELDGVADQIDEDLPQASGIADERVGHVRHDAARQLEAFLVRARRQQADGVLDDVAESERDALERQLARLDLREVEDVVDEREQRLARVLDRAQVVALLGGRAWCGARGRSCR